MASMIRFFRSKDKNENIEYKIGKIVNLEYKEFKYFELLRTDILRNNELKLHIDASSKVICTSIDDVEFTNDTVLIIDDYRYNIRSIYEELDEDTNNFFGIKSRKRTYLTIIKDV